MGFNAIQTEPCFNAPVGPAGYSMTEAFKAGMRKNVGAVAVVTAASDTRNSGLTVSSVRSVSAEPPSLSLCVNKSASAHELLCGAKTFAVNLLGDQQEWVARQFSDSSARADRFRGPEWDLDTAAPTLISGHAAIFICSRHQIIDVFTHSLIIGVINSVDVGDASPLIYADGEYSRLRNVCT